MSKRTRCRACGTTLNVNRSTRLCGDCAHIIDRNAKELMDNKAKAMKKKVVLF